MSNPVLRWRTLLLVLVITAAGVIPSTLSAGALLSASATGTDISGVTGGGSPAAAAAFGSWRGRSVTLVSNYLPRRTWSDIADPYSGGPSSWRGSGDQVTWAVPMLPTSGGSIETGATGAYDTYFRQLAQNLVANGQADANIRLGWEMNGTWMPWSAVNDPTAWISYWRQIVTTMRSVPGSHLTFDWSPSAGAYVDLPTLYPGDGYVDQVGMSVYDQSWIYSPSQSTQRWNEIDNGQWGSFGLAWLAAFGAAHSKPMAFGEWGLSNRCDGHGGNDDAYFIKQMHTFFTTHNVAFETYFNIDSKPPSTYPTTCEYHAINAGTFPDAAAAYRQLWATPMAMAPTGVTGRAPTASDVNLVSARADRGGPVALSGARLTGAVYVFARPTVSGVEAVEFYLDRGATGAPTNVERDGPYDLEGSGPVNAYSLRTDGLYAGTHTLTTVTVTSRGRSTSTVTFTTTGS